MKGLLKKISLRSVVFTLLLLTVVVLGVAAAGNVSAAEVMDDAAATTTTVTDNSTAMKAIAAAIAIGVVATAGAIGMAVAISKTADSISRQPEAEGPLRTSLMLGLVFIETAIIYALIVAILIVFVL